MNKDFLKRIKIPYPAKLKQQWGAFSQFWYNQWFESNKDLLGKVIHVQGASKPSRFNLKKLCHYIAEQDDGFKLEWHAHHKKKEYKPIDVSRALYRIAREKKRAKNNIIFPYKHFAGTGIVGIFAKRIPQHKFKVLYKKVPNEKKTSSGTEK
jgi:hypothetical protein